MKNPIVVFLILLLIAGTGKAQDYDTGLGIKVGMAPGITAKHFVTTDAALEGIITARWGGANLSALGEFHLPVFDTQGMNFFYGGGVHIGVWDVGKARDKEDKGNKLNFGIDGIVGLEYAFFDVPLSLGLDWKPSFNIISDAWLIIDEIAFSIRYLLQ
ncbi:hypothetical protein ACFLTU_04160 [Bacteroidota bacterium]